MLFKQKQMEDLRERFVGELKGVRSELRRISRSLRALLGEQAQTMRRVRDNETAIGIINFLHSLQCDMRYIERLEAQDLVDVYTQAYAYTYFDPESQEEFSDHWMWGCKWVKEIAYKEIGKRRLTKKHRNKEMLSRVLSIDARRLSFRYFSNDGHHCMRFPRLSCFLDMHDRQVVSCLLRKIEEYSKEKTYERFNRKRILLAGWRLSKRVKEQRLRGN